MLLILLPGLDGSGQLFEPLINELPSALTAHALSYPSEGDQTYDELLTHVRPALPKAEPFLLLGWSFSGPLALMVAASPPSNLRGVILCASFESNPHPALGWLAPIATPPLFRAFPFFSQAKALLGGYSNPVMRRQLAEAHAQAGPAALAKRTRQVLRLPHTDLAKNCKVPILYLAGTRDAVVPRRNAAAIKRSAPTAQIVDIPGPHLLLLTHPAIAAKAIASFAAVQSDAQPLIAADAELVRR